MNTKQIKIVNLSRTTLEANLDKGHGPLANFISAKWNLEKR